MRRNRDSFEKDAGADGSLRHQPFRQLKQADFKPRPRAATPSSPPPPQPPPAQPQEDAEKLFQDAVAGARPLDAHRRQRVAEPPPASPGREVVHPDAEALAALCDLVAGSAPFDISDSDEYVEGAVVGTDRRLLQRLRRGEFSYQAHLDLHGLTSNEARSEVHAFLTRAYQEGKRCLLIIHGRGRNSRDQIPVLKQQLTGWLARGQWSRLVLAFTSARPCDGGVGAVYVLLRKRLHSKRQISVVNGGKL
jgi:DNA-nicking Smr family endonuclease